MWKHFKYWLSSSYPSLKYWTYFPKDCRWNLNQGNLLNLTYGFSFAFWQISFIFGILCYLHPKIMLSALIFKSSYFLFFFMYSFVIFILFYLNYAILIVYLFNLIILICSNSCSSSSWSHVHITIVPLWEGNWNHKRRLKRRLVSRLAVQWTQIVY